MVFGMYVCLCHGVSDKKIKQLILEEGITDIKQIKKCTALGSQCGKCVKMAKEILNENEIIEYTKAS
ncbi:bacterioferritin-associated ferredoxin [Vibrio zhanjiangensis]|uniref:Bacterioferritin-associated ferredoxin n=2 Tax=Vibrio zhanjiangensis TaxID=1046128 RepID=A0ABQ6EST7_9VIBR|nr:bacterioferritin-associated ferredoxin [Vibrio zhanjiangensis]